MNYTHTIEIPNSYVEYNTPEGGWNDAHYSEHYNKHVKPIFNKIQSAVNKIESEQTGHFSGTMNILWNKCRYFEMSCINTDLRRFVAQSAKLKPKHGDMFVGGRNKLEAVVKAFNKKGYYCRIEQNWI